MTKKILFLLVLVVLGLFLSVFSDIKNDQAETNPVPKLIEQELPAIEPAPVRLQEKPSPATTKNQQVSANQCDHNILDFGQQVQETHQILISALQQELTLGKTPRELLAYSEQYKTFYQSYPDLLWQAQIGNEKTKYQITSAASILMQWQGLTVIEGLSETVLPALVESLTNIEGQLSGLNMELSLSANINKAEIYQLLDDDETFNTYFQSPLSIAGSPVISPSILFVLTAKNLSIEEFSQAVSGRTFTVNDAAVAINNDLPAAYLQQLLQHTTAIGDMPVFSLNRHDAYANLADLAAAKHNTTLLEMLDKYGVRPTNEPGMITGMDIAIMNLPTDAESYQAADNFPEKYLHTLQYLKSKGYRAHGTRVPNSSESGLFFKAPNRRHFTAAQVPIPELKTLLKTIELIDSRTYEQQTTLDNTNIINALKLVKSKQDEIKARAADCQRQKALQLADEGFLTHQSIRQLIDNVKQAGGDIPQQLHQIDPALVNIWQDYESALPGSTAIANSAFIKLLQDNKYQQAFDYVIFTPLNQAETDVLFASLPEFTAQLLPLWQARISALPPSSLMMFKYLSLEKWQQLHLAKFDFSIQDRFGNDMFTPAVLHSDAALRFLLTKGYATDTEKLGLDVFDLLLEDSYQQQRLHPGTKDILPLINAPEPNHFSRIARLQKFRPQVYQQLIALDQRLIPPPGTEINKIRFLH